MNQSRPETLVELMKNALASRASEQVLRFKQNGRWIGITGEELYNRVRSVALGLYGRGIRKNDRVAILAESGPLWSICDYAVLSNGAVNIPIYPTQAVHQVEYILRESEPRLLFISNARQARRVAAALDHFPDLPLVIFQPGTSVRNAASIDELEAEGARVHAENPGLYESLINEVKADDLASIIYTSGTTGEPKGAMLTHSNIVFNTIASGTYIDVEPDNVLLSYLPLSHIFERMVLYLCLHFGVVINYAQGIETVATDLQEVRPTLMATVPRMIEKVYARIQKRAAEGSALKKKLAKWSLSVARRIARHKSDKTRVPLLLELQRIVADRLVFRKLRQAVGGRIRRMVSGGAALQTEMALVFNGAGIPVLQGYGLTETSPVIAVNTLDYHRIGTVGRPLPGVEIKIDSDGEILTRGPHVFQGYFKKPDETCASFTDSDPENGWFRTGDIGHLDSDGFITITDRKKDLIKTSAGKYVTPQTIEGLLGQSEFVEQAVVIGNNRKYVSALIVPEFERLKSWAASEGIEAENRRELIDDERVLEMFKSEVKRLTADLPDYEKVKRVALVPEEFTIEGGELTPTLKVRRRVVEEKWKNLIESLYSGSTDGA